MVVDEKAVLRATYQALKQEIGRIEFLTTPKPDHPLGNSVHRIANYFGLIGEAQIVLDEIKEAVAGKRSLQEGWRAAVQLKSDLLLNLSNELLAVVGGIHIVEKGLDRISDPCSPSGQSTLKFSGLAQNLVDDLNNRCGRGWAPILIVGEERLGNRVASIIRLRFPACDLGHLAFTADEYGYLVAQLAAPSWIEDLKSDVRRSTDPKNHLQGCPPADHSCFSLPVQRLWAEYREREDKLATIPASPFLARGRDVEELKTQEVTYACRLFADAFATLFAGPAYVRALLHLCFLPGTTFSEAAEKPAFAHRFVFALETLRWMNRGLPDCESQSGAGFDDAEGPFADEVDNTVGIPALWRATLKSAGITQSEADDGGYSRIAAEYEPWLTRIKQGLRKSFSRAFNDETLGTKAQWEIARGLKEQISKTEFTVPRWPPIWAVLNAAWLARSESPDQWATIEHNAFRLLGEPDESLLESSAPTSGSREPKESRAVREAMNTVSESLGGNEDLQYKFVTSKDPRGAFTKDPAIWQFLYKLFVEEGNQKPLTAYKSLLEKQVS